MTKSAIAAVCESFSLPNVNDNSSSKLSAQKRNLKRFFTFGLNFQGYTFRYDRDLKGWKNYFKYGYPRKVFREINGYAMYHLLVDASCGSSDFLVGVILSDCVAGDVSFLW